MRIDDGDIGRAWRRVSHERPFSGELRALLGECPDSAQVRRLLALVIDGRPSGEAAALAHGRSG